MLNDNTWIMQKIYGLCKKGEEKSVLLFFPVSAVFPEPVPERGGGSKAEFGADLFLFQAVFQCRHGVFQPDAVDEDPDRFAGFLLESMRDMGGAVAGEFFEFGDGTVPAVTRADIIFQDIGKGFFFRVCDRIIGLQQEIIDHHFDWCFHEIHDRVRRNCLQLIEPIPALMENLSEFSRERDGLKDLAFADSIDFGDGTSHTVIIEPDPQLEQIPVAGDIIWGMRHVPVDQSDDTRLKMIDHAIQHVNMTSQKRDQNFPVLMAAYLKLSTVFFPFRNGIFADDVPDPEIVFYQIDVQSRYSFFRCNVASSSRHCNLIQVRVNKKRADRWAIRAFEYDSG